VKKSAALLLASATLICQGVAELSSLERAHWTSFLNSCGKNERYKVDKLISLTVKTTRESRPFNNDSPTSYRSPHKTHAHGTPQAGPRRKLDFTYPGCRSENGVLNS